MKIRVIVYFLLVIIFFFFNFYFRPVTGNPLMTEEYKNSRSYINDLYVSNEYFKEKLLPEECYVLYDEFISDIKKGKTEGSISHDKKCYGNYITAYEAIYLDHPEFIAFKSAKGWSYEDHVRTKYYHLNSLQTFLGTRRIERELDIIKKETKDMSDKEKIIYVYDYVASHQYDRMFMYSDSNQSAYSFFTKGSSVCAGFAKASQIIFQNIGITSYLVMDEDHMWNYVEYEGKNYVFDATMGASFVNKNREGFYDGLGQTTVGSLTGLYPEYYPPIEKTPLKEVFGL